MAAGARKKSDEMGDDPETGPERTCIVSRARKNPEEMIRFVLGPDHGVAPDLKRKLPGRGVWVSLSKDAVAQAVKKQVFSRALRGEAKASADLPELIETLLRRDALQALSLVNKAGLAICGFAKVEAAIGAGAVAALVHASDASADGKRKLAQSLRRQYGPDGRPEIGAFTGEALDAALGRANVAHVAVNSGPTAKVFLASCRRLAVYRGEEEADRPRQGADLTRNASGP
ncbi:MAG: RNA-binding protein [Xanthobacteraceae bacterium]